MNSNGHKIPKEVWDIQDFPFQFFDEIISALEKSEIRILKHTRHMSSSIFSLFANRLEKTTQLIGQMLFWGGFTAAFMLAYFISVWFLVISVATYFISTKMITSSYNSAILRSSVNSELSFCFLYYSGQISVGFLNNHDIYFHEEKPSK